MEKVDENLYDAQELQYKIVYKKLAKLTKDYNNLKDKYIKIKIENEFLNKELKNLKAANIKLLKFQDEKEKIANKIKKILNKINAVKGF